MSSAPFQSPETAPVASAVPRIRNDWNSLLSDDTAVSSPAASAASVPQTNLGGGTASSGGGVHGESVIMLLDSLSSADL